MRPHAQQWYDDRTRTKRLHEHPNLFQGYEDVQRQGPSNTFLNSTRNIGSYQPPKSNLSQVRTYEQRRMDADARTALRQASKTQFAASSMVNKYDLCQRAIKRIYQFGSKWQRPSNFPAKVQDAVKITNLVA